MCAHGMKIKDEDGREKPVLKYTGWMSNSKILIDELAKPCPGCPEHASLLHDRAAQAAIWPDKLCYAILRGLRKQLTTGIMKQGVLNKVSEDPTEK